MRILKLLPKNVPVLGTTATANARVVEDVQNQLGPNLTLYRGPLMRKSLKLQNLSIPDPAQRLGWLAQNLPPLLRLGNGIIYCQTVRDAERVADWLNYKGIDARAYHADLEVEERTELEDAFLDNQIPVLVATIALGMGFDKPDVRFIIHYQRPRSVVEYYQQVGRAGRDGRDSYGILLSGEEEDDIHQYFVENAFPKEYVFNEILDSLEEVEMMSIDQLEGRVNASRKTIDQALRLLEIDGAVARIWSGATYYARTTNAWELDAERIERVLQAKRREAQQVKQYVAYSSCLMEFLLKALDDPHAQPCGKCANCQKKGYTAQTPAALLDEARQFLQNYLIRIVPRKQFPSGIIKDGRTAISSELRAEQGRCLCHYNDGEFGKAVAAGKYQDGRFSEELVLAAAELIRSTWSIHNRLSWVTAIPSLRHPQLVPDFAARLAKQLGLPFQMVLVKTKNAPEQKTMQNSAQQARNVLESLGIEKGKKVPAGVVLLVDDIYDSGWTLTVAAYLLRQAGVGAVYPFAIAKASSRGG